ncbi:uncharacterized protein LOC117191407 [Drosophila miranda]|nr:uncharacterized protein LOC117191407 [Drosophila miranda]
MGDTTTNRSQNQAQSQRQARPKSLNLQPALELPLANGQSSSCNTAAVPSSEVVVVNFSTLPEDANGDAVIIDMVGDHSGAAAVVAAPKDACRQPNGDVPLN